MIRIKDHNNYLSGAIGGFIVVAIMIILYFGLGSNFFNYQLTFQPKYIFADNTVYIDANGDFANTRMDESKYLIDSLHKSNVILTPKEYTSNVVDYYNVAFLIMSAMLVAFTLLSFAHFKSSIKTAFQDLLESEDFQKNVADTLSGRAIEYYGEQFDDLEEKIKKLDKKQKDYTKTINMLKQQISDLENDASEVELPKET